MAATWIQCEASSGGAATLTDHRHGAPLQRLGDVCVAVGLLTLDGKEERSRPNFTRVVSERRNLHRCICTRVQNRQITE